MQIRTMLRIVQFNQGNWENRKGSLESFSPATTHSNFEG